MPGGRRDFVVATHERAVRESEARQDLHPRSCPDLNITAGTTPSGQRILDIGCGTGLDVWFLAGENLVVGVDISPRSLDIARQHGVCPLIGDAERPLPFAGELFDMVIIKDVFEHILDPTGLLREAHRVLKSGGTLVANVPNHFFFWGRIRLLLGKGLMWTTLFGDHAQIYDEWDYQHIRFFTWAGFQAFLAQVEFSSTDYVWELGELLYHPKEAILARFESPDFTLRRFSPVLNPLVRLFFVLFPRRLRVAVARWRPGFFSASFYARCTKP
jgi:SAM-dependent methyltransferase